MSNEGGQLRGARKRTLIADFHARAATAARIHVAKLARQGRPKRSARGHRRGKPNSAFIAARKALTLIAIEVCPPPGRIVGSGEWK